MNRDTGEPTEIGRELFGYKKDDVHLLLADLNRDIESAREELRSCKLESDDRLAQINRLEEIVNKLKTVYENSEKTSTLMIRQAKADAEGILNNAYHAAAEIVEEASIGRKRISGALTQLDDADRNLTESFERIMKSYISMIDAVSAQTDRRRNKGVDGQLENVAESGVSPAQDVPDAQPANLLSEPDIALIKAHLSPIAEIDGVQLAWLCDGKGMPLAKTQPETAYISPKSLDAIIGGSSKFIEHLSSAPDSPNMSQAFILVDDLGVIIQPIFGNASVVVVIAGSTNPAKILSLINDKQERLAHLLSSISTIST